MKRIQRKRIKGWKIPPNAKYVGRPTKWGNPFRLTPDGFIQCYSTNREILDPWIMWSYSGGFETKDIVELYGKWLDGELKAIAPYLPTPPSLEELKGKDLACFCPPSSPCHVDVILERIGDCQKAKYTNGSRLGEVGDLESQSLKLITNFNEQMNNSEQNPQSCQTDVSSSILVNTGIGTKFIRPLEMRWQPKEDITAYELAKCLPYLLRYNGPMPYEIDKTENHFRHFDIIDHNR